MSKQYQNAQIVKHALQYYIARPDASERDLNREKNLLKQVEEEVEMLKQKYSINQGDIKHEG